MNIENETAVSSGCYKQMKNGHQVELCVCRTGAGEQPCNDGHVNVFFQAQFFVLIIILMSWNLIFYS